jgi:S-formylglutathione hydrolase FrmB
VAAHLGDVSAQSPSASSAPACAQDCPEARTPTASPVGLTADDGAAVVAVGVIDDRTRDLVVESPSVGEVRVRLLLPADHDALPTGGWPVLYLLHGATGSHLDWTASTDVESLTAPTDLLVVMPDGGDWGWYSDWWNGGAGGPPAWETFHVTELRQLLERNWGAGSQRAVAGLSMGGQGAMVYAARHPDLFRAAASFSGVLDTVGGGAYTPTQATWGDPAVQLDVWQAHNPLDLAAGLRGLDLFVSFGDGEAGPFDSGVVPDGDLEGWINGMDQSFVGKLAELGIPATVDEYGPGTHSWPYWQRELHLAMPMLLTALDEPLPEPSR